MPSGGFEAKKAFATPNTCVSKADTAAIETFPKNEYSMTMSAPVFKILKGPSPTEVGISNAVTSGLAPVFSAGSKAADLFAHDHEGLLQILHFRNQIAKAAYRRSSWIGGRIYNKFSGEETDYIPISGTHLRQTLTVVGIETPEFVVASGKYSLRLDMSEEAVSILVKTRDHSKIDV